MIIIEGCISNEGNAALHTDGAIYEGNAILQLNSIYVNIITYDSGNFTAEYHPYHVIIYKKQAFFKTKLFQGKMCISRHK